MREQGMEISSDQILIVNGAQQGIDLVLRCFLSPGDKIALSLPTYHNIFPIIGLLMAEVAPVAMTDQGPDLDGLSAAAADPLVRLIYTMPNFHNPTGVTCDPARRKKIYEIAVERNIPILEDDFEKELALEEHATPPIMAQDREGKVVYLSTFSKSLFPGIRIGWLAAPKEILGALSALKKATDLENSALLQAATNAFCRRGLYDNHLKIIKAIIRERMETAFESLEQHMPEGVTWSRPTGGYVLWISLPPGVPSERIFAQAKNRNVLVTPGTLFSNQGNDPRGVRLSLSRTGVEEIRRGIEILGQVIEGEMQSRGRGSRAQRQTPQHL
jgi:DNA-binding transcriptional MocR family regulator